MKWTLDWELVRTFYPDFTEDNWNELTDSLDKIVESYFKPFERRV